MKKFVLKILATIIVWSILIQISLSFTEFSWGNEVYSLKKEQYLKVENNINTLFIGSSKIDSHLNASLFDELLINQNIQSYNLGAPYTFSPEHYFLYESLLRQNKNKLTHVFLEINAPRTPEWSKMRTKKNFYWHGTKALKFIINYVNAGNYSLQKKIGLPALYLLTSLNKHFSLAHLAPSKESDMCTGNDRKGFCPMDNRPDKYRKGVNKQKQIAKKYYKDGAIKRHLNAYHLSVLLQLIKQSTARGIHLTYIITPRGAQEIPELLALKNALPQKHIIDLGKPMDFPELYDFDHTSDEAHLNEEGAKEFTKLLAQKFSTKIQ